MYRANDIQSSRDKHTYKQRHTRLCFFKFFGPTKNNALDRDTSNTKLKASVEYSTFTEREGDDNPHSPLSLELKRMRCIIPQETKK